MKEPARECQPVIDAQKRQQEAMTLTVDKRGAKRRAKPTTMRQIKATAKKKMASTIGEIQKISLETCITGPHRAQLSL